MTYMTVKEARYHNARLLQESLPGGQREFCEKLNKAQSQVSSFLSENPVKGIGDKIAKQIEEAFGKPKGWLDTPHNQVVRLTPEGQEPFSETPSVNENQGNYLPSNTSPKAQKIISDIIHLDSSGALTETYLDMLQSMVDNIPRKPNTSASAFRDSN